ncbi:MAG: hypothetical protein ABIO39_08790 [Caulobacteraceae bacterium]
MLAPSARADDGDNRTVQAQFSPGFVGGKLQACNLSFNLAHRDRATMNGSMTLLAGTVAVAKANGRTGMVMRLGVIQPSVNGQPSIQIAPAEAALQDGRRTNASSLAGSRDVATGYKAFIFKADQQTASMLSTMVAASHLTGYYALKAGGLGSNFDVDLTVAKTSPQGQVTRDPDMAGRFTACLRDLGRPGA